MTFFKELIEMGWNTLKDNHTKPSQKLSNAGLALVYSALIATLFMCEAKVIKIGYQGLQSLMLMTQPYGFKAVLQALWGWTVIATIVVISIGLVKFFRGGAAEMYVELNIPHHIGTVIFVSSCVFMIVSQRYVFNCQDELMKYAGSVVIYSALIALFKYFALAYIQNMDEKYDVPDVGTEVVLYNLRNKMQKSLFCPNGYNGNKKKEIPVDNYATCKFVKKYHIYVVKEPDRNDELFALLKRIVQNKDNFAEENKDGWLFECDPEKLPEKFQQKLYVEVWHKDSDGIYKYTISDEPIQKLSWYDKIINFLFEY